MPKIKEAGERAANLVNFLIATGHQELAHDIFRKFGEVRRSSFNDAFHDALLDGTEEYPA